MGFPFSSFGESPAFPTQRCFQVPDGRVGIVVVVEVLLGGGAVVFGG
jgi:hypothetical protein